MIFIVAPGLKGDDSSARPGQHNRCLPPARDWRRFDPDSEAGQRMNVIGKILAGLVMGFFVGVLDSAIFGAAMWNQPETRAVAARVAFWAGLGATLVLALTASRIRFAWGRGFMLVTASWATLLGLLGYLTLAVGLPMAEVWGAELSVKGEGGPLARALVGAAAGVGFTFGVLILAILVLITVLLLRAPQVAAPTYVVAPPAMPQAAGGVTVLLADPGANKIAAIKAVREITGLGLKEAKDLVDAPPQPVVSGVSMQEAERIRQHLQGAGIRVQIASVGQAPPLPQAPAWQPSPDSNPVRRA
jgi:large subunit ribosomal protein L7/L12